MPVEAADCVRGCAYIWWLIVYLGTVKTQERLLAVLEAIPELTAAGGGEGLRVLRHYEDEEEVEEEEGMENETA